MIILYTGGKKFTYVTGDGVIRTMNAIFGNGGWSSKILSKELIVSFEYSCFEYNIVCCFVQNSWRHLFVLFVFSC